MESIKEETDRNDKVRMILEASQRRFGLYGVEKTSMREIADDLNLSKASLYYYFPDKETLYKAVIEKEQEEFLSRISDTISNINEPEQLLLEYAHVRLSYFRTLLNLSRLRMESYSDLRPAFRESIRVFKEKEKEIIIKIFEKGTRNGIFFIDDADQTASIFLDLLKGLRVTLVNEKKTLSIEQDEFDQLLQKTLLFTSVFIKALKYR